LRPGGPFGQDGGLGPPGDLEARRKYLDQAIVLLKGLLQDQPSSPPCRHLLALCCREMSPRGGQAGQTAYDNAVDILTGLAKDFPQALDYQFDLCETYAAVDSRGPLPKREDLTRVEARLRKALEISRELLRQQPKVPEYLASQSHIYHKLGEVTRRMRRPDDAEQYDRKAVEMQAALAKEFPEVTTYQVWLAAFRNSLADTLILRGNLNGARPLLETSISQTERLLQDNPTMWYLHALLMDANRLLASVLQQTKESDLAAKATRAAEDHSRKLHPGAK
jgi:tetratricopeptide (TPR) repeat protein